MINQSTPFYKKPVSSLLVLFLTISFCTVLTTLGWNESSWAEVAEKDATGKDTAEKTKQTTIEPAPALGKTHSEEKIDFNLQIRPLLSNACFHCHGPAEEDREADLRLDTEEGAFKKTDGGAAIVPGNSHKSLIVERLLSDDPDLQMPPKDSGKKLTLEQRKLIAKWIDQGAPWSKHWSFETPKRPEIPTVKNKKWVLNPIDAFVLKRLENKKLSPSPQASKDALIRRVSLDLTGLPPTIREVDMFLKDKRPDAYERLVDQLLSSKHYGEKWARHWLDAARYSDSDGFEKDKPRFVWHYRDWVVNALNEDMPYNQFVVEQLAGDLLPDPTQEQLIATGFLRNSMVNEEGGADPEQFRMEAMFDRMDAIGKSMLGLTIQCTQCHSHKYDPITHDEYYQMFAFLNSSYEHNAIVYSQTEQLQIAGIKLQTESIENKLKKEVPDWKQKMHQWEQLVKNNQPNWKPVPVKNVTGSNGQRHYYQKDGTVLAQGFSSANYTSKMGADVQNPVMKSIQLELLTDPNLPGNGPGRGLMGNLAITEFSLLATSIKDPKKKHYVNIIKATADYGADYRKLDKNYSKKTGDRGFIGSVQLAIDNDNATAWSIDAGPKLRNQSRKAVFIADKNFAYEGGTNLQFIISQKHGGWNSNANQSLNMGCFRISVCDQDNVEADPIPRKVRLAFKIPHEKRTPAQTQTIFDYWRTTRPEWEAANQKIAQLWKLHPEGSMQLVMMEMETPRKTFLLDRGEFLKPKHEIQPGVPKFLNPFPKDQPKTRLTFAKWLTNPESPTIARTAINRTWQNLFGRGIVETVEDLGSQGAAPSHPKLIDWLAVEFVEKGWSMKKLQKLIVMSNTYQQNSNTNKKLLEIDPYNQLLAHGPRFRVDGELVRDIALRSSGLLSTKMGGPGVYPPSPQFLYLPPASYGTKTWDEERGEDRYRRSLYTFRYRTVPNPVMKNFDTPNGDSSCVRRDRSNTPLQALTTLNETLFLECARNLAFRAIQVGGKTDKDKLNYIFRCCVSRKPTAEEIKVLTTLLQRQKTRLSKGELKPEELLTNTDGLKTKLPPPLKAKQVAPWIVVARVVLNLDETITKQ